MGGVRIAARIFLVALLAAGCSSNGPTPAPATPTVSAHPTPATVPTPVPTLAIDALPEVSLDPAVVTAVCDPEAAQANIEAGEATIFCGDGLVIGLRAISTVATSPIGRLYFHRPSCASIPCSTDELAKATVWGWTADGALRLDLDSRLATVTAPVRDPAAPWPPAGTSQIPLVERPVIADAPAAVADRVPYPFCGSGSFGDPTSAFACFRSAVLAGRPGELIDNATGTEGGAFTILYRFDGRGAISRTMDAVGSNGHPGPWIRQSGTLILGITPSAWDFDPWSGTEVEI